MGNYFGLKFCEFLYSMECGWLYNEMGESCIFKSRIKSIMTLCHASQTLIVHSVTWGFC